MSLPSTYQAPTAAITRPRVAQSPPGSPARAKELGAGASPFTSSQGNPNFQPQKITARTAPTTPVIVPKPPKPPEKPLMPYMRYSKSVWEAARAANPDLKLWEIGKVIGSMWRELSDEKKQEFQEQYENEKVEYEKALKVYHNSPAYQAYLVEKNKAKKAEEQAAMPAPIERPSAPSFHGKAAPPPERRIDIQPAEDDEDQDEGFSVKHVAHTRYLRNHRLMSDIFSEALVPDVRSVVTNSRMQVLKRQVQSLTMHQKKLEDELQQIEEKFESKKRKFIDASETFRVELKELCSQVLDQEAFQAVCDEKYDDLKKKMEEEKKKDSGENQKKKSEGAGLLEPNPPVSSVPYATPNTASRSITNGSSQGAYTPTPVSSTDTESGATGTMQPQPWGQPQPATYAGQTTQAAAMPDQGPPQGGTMHPLQPPVTSPSQTQCTGPSYQVHPSTQPHSYEPPAHMEPAQPEPLQPEPKEGTPEPMDTAAPPPTEQETEAPEVTPQPPAVQEAPVEQEQEEEQPPNNDQGFEDQPEMSQENEQKVEEEFQEHAPEAGTAESKETEEETTQPEGENQLPMEAEEEEPSQEAEEAN
ncbi:unnamed protein product [Cyprideis torosa]|uniref:Uncharacterized protein n=1 Tax=Cyprideis torosa TaxID=163714 RepID=A0A7R8ZJE0_9CRUS|nr:unnamed protein product [Cyprideis torosa]CAG0882081.1 unnamed protein product [Cyprideis torosa]